MTQATGLYNSFAALGNVVSMVELVMRLEEEFDITVDEEELEGIETVQAAFDLISSKLG